jgi:hypothetical protein
MMKKVLAFLGCLTMVFAFYATAHGGVVAPVKLISQTPLVIQSPNAHIGQPAKNIVVLYSDYRTGSSHDSRDEFFRTLPDGSIQPTSFKVPPGQLLVVTDVNWLVVEGHPGKLNTLRLFINNPSTGHSHTVFASNIILNSEGEGAISENMTTGFTVSSDAMIKYYWVGGGEFGLVAVTLRGYLIPAK